jgi:hypothetical protein
VISRVETIERHLHGVERIIVREHLQMNSRILVSGKADKADFALLLGVGESLGDTARGEDEFRVVIVDNLVNLPDIKMIGFQAAQGVFQLTHGDILAATVGADLGHDDHLIALAFERLADADLAVAVVIFPGVVEKIHAGIDGERNDLIHFLLVFGAAQVEAAQTHRRDLNPGLAQLLFRNGSDTRGGGGGGRSGRRLRKALPHDGGRRRGVDGASHKIPPVQGGWIRMSGFIRFHDFI